MPEKTIAFVILAAGESRRMGDIKQLLEWRNKTLLQHLIDKSIASTASKTYVVVGSHADRIEASIQNQPVTTIYNNNWKKGMGSSIAVAVEHISNLPERFDGILISLVDQPLIPVDHFNQLILKFVEGKTPIVATTVNGSLGVPAVFGSEYFNELLKLDGSQGAKNIIYHHQEEVTAVRFENAYMDLDTPEDYRRFLQQQP